MNSKTRRGEGSYFLHYTRFRYPLRVSVLPSQRGEKQNEEQREKERFEEKRELIRAALTDDDCSRKSGKEGETDENRCFTRIIKVTRG